MPAMFAYSEIIASYLRFGCSLAAPESLWPLCAPHAAPAWLGAFLVSHARVVAWRASVDLVFPLVEQHPYFLAPGFTD